MKQQLLLLTSLVLASTSTSALANVDVSTQYTENNAIGEHGVTVQAETLASNNIGIEVGGFLNDDKAHSSYVGVTLPITFNNTKATVTPSIGVEQYFSENVTAAYGKVQIKHPLAIGFDIIGSYKHNIELEKTDDLEGETYSIGLSKTF